MPTPISKSLFSPIRSDSENNGFRCVDVSEFIRQLLLVTVDWWKGSLLSMLSKYTCMHLHSSNYSKIASKKIHKILSECRSHDDSLDGGFKYFWCSPLYLGKISTKIFKGVETTTNWFIWVFPKRVVPQNGWFILKKTDENGWFGRKTHHFRKHPYIQEISNMTYWTDP